MLNIDKVNTVYLACGATDLRRSIDGLAIVIQTELKLNPFEKAIFVFCNKHKKSIILYDYQKTRSSSCPKKF
jgi:transposase